VQLYYEVKGIDLSIHQAEAKNIEKICIFRTWSDIDKFITIKTSTPNILVPSA